jgi:hypothetical protein
MFDLIFNGVYAKLVFLALYFTASGKALFPRFIFSPV